MVLCRRTRGDMKNVIIGFGTMVVAFEAMAVNSDTSWCRAVPRFASRAG